MRLLGDRFGGVLFDLQEIRRGHISADEARQTPRGELLLTIVTLIGLVENMDQRAIDEQKHPQGGCAAKPNADRRKEYFNSEEARSARMAAANSNYERCIESEHDRYGQRKTDCAECHPPVQVFTCAPCTVGLHGQCEGGLCTCLERTMAALYPLALMGVGR